MDINCTNPCFYQTEGKCQLRELPADFNAFTGVSDADCPYYYYRSL